jgi:hypothetical protein
LASRLLPGYKRLPGTARRYETPSGESISRRQYENRVFSKSGWASWSEFQRVSQEDEYKRFARAYANDQKGKPWYRQRAGKEKFSHYQYRSRIPRGMLEPDSEFNQAYLKARRSGFRATVGGPFDKFLKMIGLRDPDATYDVGDSPGPT